MLGRIAAVILLVGLFATGCGEEKKKKPKPVTVSMRLDESADLAKDFFAQPFPLESRRAASGTYDLAGFPNPASYAIFDFIRDEVAEDLAGYGTNAAVYLPFRGALDFSQAVTDVASSMQGKAAVLLVNVDKLSPDYLKFSPILSRFFRGESRYLPPNTLSIVPLPGFPLRGNTLYAALVVDDFGLAPLEGKLVQNAALTQALAGGGPWGDTFAPLREALPGLGLDSRKIVGATVYRTVDFAAPLMKARDWLYEANATVSTTITDWDTETNFRWVEGKFTTVRFQHGEPPYVQPGEGGFKLDDNGVPIAAGTEELRFAISLPPGTPPPGGWPVVIYAHGTGGDWRSAIPYYKYFTAPEKDEGYNLAQRGIALVSYDQPYHGDRNPRVPNCVNGCPQLYTFNFLNPKAARDGFRQSALDAVQLLRSVLAMNITKFGGSHTFNPDKVYYMGHSQGSTSGPMFVAIEPKVKAAVFSGPAGGLTLTFLFKTAPIDIPGIAGFIFGDQEGFGLFHPTINLFQAYLESVDPMNYARLVAQEPREPAVFRHVLMTEGLTDEYTPPIQAEAFGIALGVPPIKPLYQDLIGFSLAGLDPVDPGVSDNLTNAYGKTWTGGLLQFPDTGHFSIYCQVNANKAYADFLASVVEGNPTIADPGERTWSGVDDPLNLFCNESSAKGAPGLH